MVLSPIPDAAIPASPQAGLLAGDRLHLQEGPIDLVIGANGPPEAVGEAYGLAAARFDGLLSELVRELPLLRSPVADAAEALRGDVARRMVAATLPHSDCFVTPMAAVAGAVADEILAAMTGVTGLTRVYVNNGGDIAVYLTPGQELRIGTVSSLAAAVPDGFVRIAAEDGIGGVATSGADGRSLSLGIADAVSVLAENAAAADAAATLIANAVNVDHPAIRRVPAESIDPDSDLRGLWVTTGVGDLPKPEIAEALDRGQTRASDMLGRNLIRGALLSCQGQLRAVGTAALPGSAAETVTPASLTK